MPPQTTSPPQTPEEDSEEEILPSNLPLQNVPSGVYVPIAKDPNRSKHKAVSITSKLLIFFALIASVVLWNIWVMQPFFVDGESMVPTLNNKDTLLVNKFPKTWASITNSRYIPSRYDVVIVKNPQKPDERFVKRVIGLPGERVVLKKGVITVYNETNPRGSEVTNPPCCNDLEETSGSVDTVVREGHIFVVGDNRTLGGSIDSRSSLGQIPSRDIIGRVVVRIAPISDVKKL